jgi:hypothetical protein
MSSYQFKFKPDKIKYLTNISTLDSSHSKISEEMIKKRENLPKKELKLEKLQKKLADINNNIENENFTNMKSKILTEIDNLETEINEIINYDKELDYFSRTYEILFNYYDIIDGNTIISEENIIQNNEKDNNIKDNIINNFKENIYDNINENIMDNENIIDNENIDNDKENNSFFQDITENDIFKKEKVDKLEMLNYLSKLRRKEKKITRKRVKNIESLIKENNNIFDYLDSTKDKSEINNKFIIDENKEKEKEKENKPEEILKEENYDLNQKKIKLDRASLYEDYKTLLEGYFLPKKNNKVCINCNIDKILIYSEGIYACVNCGDVERCIIENESTNYKDPMIEKPTFPYKRKNHFCEWILYIFLTARKSINSYIR